MLAGSSAAAASINYDLLENKARRPVPSGKLTAAETVNESIPCEPIRLAAIDYCYAGSIADPSTGEGVDLFVPCPEDGPEQNIDLA
jgi:hypothetical protein